jgi:nucleoid DNA-binding protein
MAMDDLVKAVSEETGYQTTAVREITRERIDYFKQKLAAEGVLGMRGFGTFKVVRRSEKIMTTLFCKPIKRKKAVVPASNGVKFRLSAPFKKTIHDT